MVEQSENPVNSSSSEKPLLRVNLLPGQENITSAYPGRVVLGNGEIITSRQHYDRLQAHAASVPPLDTRASIVVNKMWADAAKRSSLLPERNKKSAEWVKSHVSRRNLGIYLPGDFQRVAHGLVKYHINRRAPVSAELEYSEVSTNVRIYADMLEIKRRLPRVGVPSGGGLRGSIIGFSRQSRKRMIAKVASIRDFDARFWLMLTCTYSDFFSFAPTLFKWHLELIEKRLKRKYPDLGAIWRLELKNRKTGIMAGRLAPHFHIMAGFPGRLDYDEISDLRENFSRDWNEVAGVTLQEWFFWSLNTFGLSWSHFFALVLILSYNKQKHHKAGTNVTRVYDQAHAMRYVAKYVAKEDEDGVGVDVGRRWGVFGKLDFSPVLDMSITETQFRVLRRYLLRLMQGRALSANDALEKSGVGRYVLRLAKSSLFRSFSVFGFGDQSRGSPGYSVSLIGELLSHICFEWSRSGDKFPGLVMDW